MMEVTRKTVVGTGWPLRDASDLMSALTDLTDQGWTGGIQFEGGQWRLRLSADGKNTVNAVLGQWLILDGELRAVSCDDFDEAYTSDPVTFPMAMAAPEEVAEESEPFGSQTSPDVSSRMVG